VYRYNLLDTIRLYFRAKELLSCANLPSIGELLGSIEGEEW